MKKMKKMKRIKKMKKKKRKKYNGWVNDYPFSYLVKPPDICHNENMDNILKQLQLSIGKDPGFFFGHKETCEPTYYIGLRQGEEGNILVVGGNGSGKSSGLAKPTLAAWHGAICVTDVKGELSDSYQKLYRLGKVKRPFIIFDPTKIDSTGYDPFYLLKQDEDNLYNSICEIADALIPIPHDIKEPFWLESEQSILKAALSYGFHLGLSFRESIIKIMSSTATNLVMNIIKNGDDLSKMFIGETSNLKPETIASIDRELRNKLAVFVTDKFIFNAFREDSDCFSWDDLDEYNIFLRIPADKIDQWGNIINLMYTQLIRHLERRPEKYSPDGKNNVPILLLMDEFARFGKLNIITDAVSTLRSKNVNICLFIQSLAQLDKIYGVNDRRIILDNCQYKAILQANDADTQEYFSRLIGTHINKQQSKSEQFDDIMDTIGYSNQLSEIRERIIFPHELSTLNDILLLSPYGFCHIDKLQLYDIENNQLVSNGNTVYAANAETIPVSETSGTENDFLHQGITVRTIPAEEVLNDYGPLLQVRTFDPRELNNNPKI